MQQFNIVCLFVAALALGLQVSCGVPKPPPKIKKQLAYGSYAATNQFPYQAAISVTNSAGVATRCAGALIDPAYVLTAASCFKGGASVTVRLGTIYFNYYGQLFSNIPITNVIIHPQFNETGMRNESNINPHNNVALIRLPTNAVLDASVSVIQILPKASFCGSSSRSFQVAGWGQYYDGGPIYNTEYLMFANLNEMSNAACMQSYGNIDPNHICAKGTYYESNCKGDDGAPLVVSGSPKYLIAMVSWGKPSCVAAQPRVYQLVTPFIDWLRYRTGINTL